MVDVFSSSKKYLIRWSGLDEYGDPWIDTWEPAKNVESDCPNCSGRMTRFFQERNSCMQNGVPSKDMIEKLSRVFSLNYNFKNFKFKK